MAKDRPVGDLMDGLGVVATLDDDALVSSALVVLAVVNPDGREFVKLAWSDGQSWIARRGLLEVALDAERLPPGTGEDEEDD